MANGEDVTISNLNFTCKVGDLLKISRPGCYPPVDFPSDADTTQYLNGFYVMYPEIGEFEGNIGNSAVFYRHKTSGRQIIEYLSDGLGKYKFRVVLEGVVVHDHASIHTGGPAFATYYAIVPTEET
jgi:hypothetical protein